MLLIFFMNNLVDFSSFRHKNFKKLIDEFNIKECVEDAVQWQSNQAKSKHINVHKVYKGFKNNYHIVRSDKQRIQQVLTILL